MAGGGGVWGGVCLPGVTGKERGAAEAILITFQCDTCDPHASPLCEGGAGVGGRLKAYVRVEQ